MTAGPQPYIARIQRLGTPDIPSRLSVSHFMSDRPFPFYPERGPSEGGEPRKMLFELAGPRRRLYFDPSRTRLAIATCGGLCPGINDVIRAIVMEAFHGYGVPSVLGVRYGLEGLIPACGHAIMELSPDAVASIHQFGGTILGTSRGPQPSGQIADALERLNINALFLIGGDGTMRAAAAIAAEIRRRELPIAILGIPKTIDNDISFISQSFGFETAVDKATEAIQCAHTEALGSVNGIGVVKLMGRESGFIAAHATLSLKEVNFVLVPEAPFALHGAGGLLPALERRLVERGHAVIVVAEGAGQDLIQETDLKDASGNIILADIAAHLLKEIRAFLTARGMPHAIKYIDPSYIIRSVPANANDRVYCGMLGQFAVHAALAGKTAMVVAKLMDRFVHMPLELVTEKRRRLDTASDYWRAVIESTGQARCLAGVFPGESQ